MTAPHGETAAFTGLVDLASERVGGKAILASDEFFAEKENLLKPGRGIFIPDKYTENGKWMDGWETRRKRTEGHDWCIIRLGLSGTIGGVDIDTNHFLGNHPPYASIEACCLEGDTPDDAFDPEAAQWAEILEKSVLKPGSQNIFPVRDQRRWTHLRLNIYPDGGVARFRVYGHVVPPWDRLKPDEIVDLAAVTHGGAVVACSDMFFSPMQNMIMPGPSLNMGDGWETRRRRGPGYDWAVVRLGHAGEIRQLEIDTSHFKGNYPDRCSVDICYSPDETVDSLNQHTLDWKVLLPETRLQANQRHFLEKELAKAGPATHVRLNIYPDGGIARFRAYGVRVADRKISGEVRYGESCE
jgi:allantoicase